MPAVRELDPRDAPDLTALYTDYEWWADRTETRVREALAETDVALGIVDDGEMLAAARVLTDYVYYARVYDVIVAADRRGEGLGERLLRAVVDHPDLGELPGLSLGCREGLVPFYESLGFEVFDREMDVPEGGTEDLVRMTIEFDDEPEEADGDDVAGVAEEADEPAATESSETR
jgi:predicted GNAT family N-acyltransferase